MANRFGRAQRGTTKTAARKRRLAIRPKADRLWLLAGTAIITGAVMWPTHPALAECIQGVGEFSCNDNSGGIETTPQVFNPTDGDDVFEVFIGREGPDIDGNIIVPDADDQAAPALAIDGSGGTFSGTVDVFDGSSIQQLESGATGYDGLRITNFLSVELNVHAGDGDDDRGQIRGGNGGVEVNSFYFFNVENDGLIESFALGEAGELNPGGAGIAGSFGEFVEIDNQDTIRGFDGTHFQSIYDYEHDNADGVTLGYGFIEGDVGGDGINLDVTGYVDIHNGGYYDGDEDAALLGGVIAGRGDGISISRNDYGIEIDNGGFYEPGYEGEVGDENGLVFRSGGLIFGQGNQGINIEGFEDDVYINNRNTNIGQSVSIAEHDNIEGLGLELPDLPNVPSSDDDFSTGIWGADNGIYINGDYDGQDYESRYVEIENQAGRIVGAGQDGIYVTNLDGEDAGYWDGGFVYTGRETALRISNYNSGVTWGEEDGIDASNIRGGVEIYNDGFYNSANGGTSIVDTICYGDEECIAYFGEDLGPAAFAAAGVAGGKIVGDDGNGILLSGIEDYVDIYNARGEIWGLDENGVDVSDVSEVTIDPDGGVYIYNGYFGEDGIDNGGLIYGNEIGIRIADATRTEIFSGKGGFILGEGDGGDDKPVISLSLSTDGDLGEDYYYDEMLDTWVPYTYDQAAGLLVNFGIASSYDLPHFDLIDDSLVALETPDWEFDDASFRSDLAGLQSYIANGGSKSQLDGLLDPLGDAGTATYVDAASALLVRAESGAADIYNYDFMAGRLDLQSFNGDDPEADANNYVYNEGVWFVTDTDEEDGTSINYEGIGFYQDVILNNGLTQTAFGQESDRATFDADVFAQGSAYEKYMYTLESGYEDYLERLSHPKTGILSMVDGVGNDQVDILGNFYGSNPDEYDAGFRSFVALDVFLQDETDFNNDLANNGSYPQDFLDIGQDAEGTTGLIIRRVNDETIAGVLGSEIPVVHVAGDVNYTSDCIDEFCSEGDVFYIASQSDGYFESEEGTGFIEDGLFAWGLRGEATSSATYKLVGLPGPGAFNAPQVATGFQQIADEIFDVVYDHNYGTQFRSSGGGGADLPVEAAAYDAPASAGGTQTGLWAKVTGSKTDRDSTVSDLGTSFDTGSNQDIYTILGGGDFKWDPNSPFRIGLFGGYVTSTMDFELGSGEVDYEGGVVGTYLAYNNGAFYADATVKGEFLTTDYAFDSTTVDADGTNIGVSANTGYRFASGGAYVEPLASFRYVHSSVDDFSGGGGSVEYSDPESIKAGAGARVGTAFATGAATTELSLLGRVWNEFGDDNEVTVDDGLGNVFVYSDDISGLYGEVEGTVLVTSSDGTLSGFLSANGKFGDDFTSYGGKAGLRKGF